MRKLILAALILASCNKSSRWTNDQIHSQQKDHRSSKLSYLCKDPIHGIDLEFLQTQEHLKVYLNVHSVPVPAYQGNSKAALVKLVINSEILRCQAYRLEGGQRFLVPDEIAETMIEALKNGQEITVSLPGYQSIVKPGDFSKKFDRLQNPYPLKNPFQLPL